MCDTCEFSRRIDPEGRARFEAEAPKHAEFLGIPVEQLLCLGYMEDAMWARMSGLG